MPSLPLLFWNIFLLSLLQNVFGVLVQFLFVSSFFVALVHVVVSYFMTISDNLC